MNLTIPFTKEIIFKSKIAEITSISLEHDISINEGELLGDFIISGEYKNLDINVDTYPFSHVVPFSVSLDDDIDIDSLKYEIVDFTYSILNEDTLRVDISLLVTADKIFKKLDEVFEKVDDETARETIDNSVEHEEIDDKDVSQEVKVEEEKVIDYESAQDDFVTYHIHIVKIDESVESICSTYNITKEELFELNDIKEVSIGDKLIIREVNDK